MRTRPRARWGRVILIGLASIAMLLIMSYAVIIGVVNCSFRYAPPTDEELREDPSLVKYLPEGDPRIEVYSK